MKKITPLNSLSLLIALFCAVNFGFGQSIFTNPITDPNPENDNPYVNGQIVDANLTVSGIGRGIGIQPNLGADRYNAWQWNSPSLNLNDYYEFILTPNAGYEIDLVSFVYTGQTSPNGPINFLFRSSLDGFTANIGTPTDGGTTIDLTAAAYQGITNEITFRIYSWGATSGLGTFSINDFTFNGSVNALGSCTSVSTWDGVSWDVAPSTTAVAIIDGDYNANNLANSFTACSLQINTGNTLTVNNGGFVEVENDVIVNGVLLVETQGNFVQNDDGGIFTNNGVSRVNKQTAPKADWFYYTYWSSPVVGETIGNVFTDVDGDRRFWFNAANFLDTDGDDIDDNGDDWQYALGGDTMLPGVGYASTESRFHFPNATGVASFEGPFNTGDVTVGISYNPANVVASWNFIGNPYPSAIDFDAFYAANSTVVAGAAYFWSQATPHAESNNGNEQSNFSQNDYATYTVGTGGAAGGGPDIPDQFIPSGQGFFIDGLINGSATFTNAMRMADGTSNAQFFKNSTSKKISNSIQNRLWINLTSDNGLFNQILVGYVDGATNNDDGSSYDAKRFLTSDFPATLYSIIDNLDKKFAIQGRDINSINEDEIIKLGFATNIDVTTRYELSIAQLEGAFLSSNPIYLKDNLLNTLHDLSTSDYTFTSEVGEFNDRFEIVFNANALSVNDVSENSKSLKIIELENDKVQFTTSDNLSIKTINIFDLLGRQLYRFEGNSPSETYKLSNLSNSVYIAKVTLSNGTIISKKAVKK